MICTAIGELVSRQVLFAPYSAPIEGLQLRSQLLDDSPQTLSPVRWQQRQVLGAWRVGDLVALIDLAVVQERDSTELPNYRPVGLLRFLVLPERTDLVDEAAGMLLAAADAFWRANAVGHVRAFIIGAGYPAFQAGQACCRATGPPMSGC